MEKITKIINIIKIYDPEKIIIFGSYARGDVDEHSDLDLVIIKKTNKRFIERIIEVDKLLPKDMGKVDIFVYTPEEWTKMVNEKYSFAEQVLKDGKVIYEKK